MSDLYYRGQDWWANEDHCRHDGNKDFECCHKCQTEQFFNSHLIRFACILLKLELCTSCPLPDANNEVLLELTSYV